MVPTWGFIRENLQEKLVTPFPPPTICGHFFSGGGVGVYTFKPLAVGIVDAPRGGVAMATFRNPTW